MREMWPICSAQTQILVKSSESWRYQSRLERVLAGHLGLLAARRFDSEGQGIGF